MNGVTQNVPDAHQDRRFNASQDSRSGFRTQAVLCIPLTSPRRQGFSQQRGSGRVIGVLQLINKHGATTGYSSTLDHTAGFSNDDVEIAQKLGTHIAVALDSAQREALKKHELQEAADALEQMRGEVQVVPSVMCIVANSKPHIYFPPLNPLIN